MSLDVFAVVIFAAILHATWNALVKGGADKATAMGAVIVGQGVTGAALLPFAPPLAPAAFPYLLAGVVLHQGYQLFLIAAYRIGDLTQVYPIARGVSPLLVALGSALLLGVRFSGWEIAALLLITVGIMSNGFIRRHDGGVHLKPALLALCTGGFIASYSLVDGQGARIGGTALGFFGWLAALNAVVFGLGAAILRPGLMRQAVRLPVQMIGGGAASFTAYVLVVWAFTKAPMALVTALRETSIIFALMIGVVFLGERLTMARTVAVAVTVAGVILLRLQSGW